MTLSTILLIVFVLLLIGALPTWAIAAAGVMDPAVQSDWLS